MAIWAIGFRNEPATRFVESTEPQDVLAQLKPGEDLAPITFAQMQAGVILKGDMAVETIPAE